MRKDILEGSVVSETAGRIILSHLLHPTARFERPSDVLGAAHLSEQEKRAILASWASDQYAVESMPALRRCPGSGGSVPVAEVLAALKSLDGDASEERATRARHGKSKRRLALRGLVPMHRHYRQ